MNEGLHFLLFSFLGGLAALALSPIFIPLFENWLEHLPANRRKREIRAQESEKYAEAVIEAMQIRARILAELEGKRTTPQDVLVQEEKIAPHGVAQGEAAFGGQKIQQCRRDFIVSAEPLSKEDLGKKLATGSAAEVFGQPDPRESDQAPQKGCN